MSTQPTKDPLGDRIKSQYEDRTRILLPRRTYTIVRLDGKAFHTYTSGLERPFDQKLMDDMDSTAKYLCEKVSGCKLAYVQSDEISLVLTDFDNIGTQSWFDGNLQKITSISASMATAKFNQIRPDKLAFFDSRAFTIPDPIEVSNYLIWRQKDATRNSILMAAQSMFSHSELHGKPCDQLQEMMWSKGTNWNDYPDGFKRGRCIIRQVTGEGDQTRSSWIAIAPPIFTQDRLFIESKIPTYDLNYSTLNRQLATEEYDTFVHDQKMKT